MLKICVHDLLNNDLHEVKEQALSLAQGLAHRGNIISVLSRITVIKQ